MLRNLFQKNAVIPYAVLLRYSVGVIPIFFLKAVQNALSLGNPASRPISFTERLVFFSIYFAALILIFTMYS